MRCLKATLDLEDCQGVAVFCYQYFFDPLTGQSIAETAEERDHFVPAFKEVPGTEGQKALAFWRDPCGSSAPV